MKTRLLSIVLALSAVLLIASVSFAAQFNFTPSVIVSEEYTDNLFRDPDDEEEDFITSTGVSLTGEVLWQTAGVELNYTPSYRKYADNTEFDGWRHSASFLAWKEYKRNTRFELRNTFLRTEDPADESDDIDVDDPLVGPAIESDRNRRGREEYYTNSTEARVSHRFGADDQVFGGTRYRIFRDVNTPEDDESDDSDILEPFAGFAYWFSVRWGVEGDGSYSNRDFKDRNDREEFSGTARLLRRFTRHFDGFIEYNHTYLDFDEETDDSDYHVYAPTLGVRYQFEENAQIRIGAGYFIQDSDDGEDDEEGFFVNSEIFKTWPYRRGFVTLLGSSGYDQEDSGSEDLGLNIFYEGRVSAGYNFTTRFSGDIFGGYRYDDFPNEEPDRTDQTIKAGAGLNLLAFRWMNLRLEYNFDNVDSDDEDEEFTENSVLFTVTIAPTQPFRLNR